MVILVLLTIQGYIRRHIQRFNAAHEVHLRSIHVNLCLRLAWFIPHPFLPCLPIELSHVLPGPKQYTGIPKTSMAVPM